VTTNASTPRETAPSSTTREKSGTADNPIRPEDARNWIDKECVVEMTVRSTKAFDWAVLLNSKDKDHYADADNLRIAILADSAGQEFREQGITNLESHFFRRVIRVSGKVEEKTDKRTGKKYLEIQVKKASTITKL
jgi:hypothetical protein